MINLDEPVVMGILNLTPDSFFDGGRYLNEQDVLQRVREMVKEGVDIIDVGAFSSRPKAESISEQEELDRLLPILNLIRTIHNDIPISIDTYRSSVARQALECGADIINDISGGNMDEHMFDVIAQYNAPYVLMHMQGTPQTMQQNPKYENVVQEVYDFFELSIKELKNKGVSTIIIDPGFGFGKSLEHNYLLLSQLDYFNTLDQPILAGISRKSMINKVLGTTPDEALNGTTVLNTIALLKGAKILRVHDVKQAKETINLVTKLNEQE